MKKLSQQDFFDLLEAINNSYSKYYRITVQKIEKKKIYGTMFVLNNHVSKEIIEILNLFPNVNIYLSVSQYAPEQKHISVFLGD